MAKPARRKCKICKEWFHPAFSNQWWCCPEHGTQLALKLQSKQRKKAEKAAEKKRRREEQKQKDKLKIRKLALKPRSYWIKQAQQAVNAFILKASLFVLYQPMQNAFKMRKRVEKVKHVAVKGLDMQLSI